MTSSTQSSTAQPSVLPDFPCYLNGAYTPLCDAKISVMDRGFIFGDGIYEVVPVYAGGRLFRFDQHMARMERSLTELRIANPHTREEWTAIIRNVLKAHTAHIGADPATHLQSVYIQISRGVALRDHPMTEGIAPTVFVMATTVKPASSAQRDAGVAAVTADDFRWEKAHIKATSLLGAVMARQISFDVGAAETIMFRRGFLSEASHSNVWLVKDGAVVGVPKDNLVLEGIRFGLIEELCQAKGILFSLRRIASEELRSADEILLSSAGKEVMAVTTLDGLAVGNGQPGPIYKSLYAAYQDAIARTATA